MPYTRGDRKTSSAELETTSRVMRTVQKQIEHYAMSLDKVRGLRQEILIDSDLRAKIGKSPEMMMEVLKGRGVPAPIAAGMAAEDFRGAEFSGFHGGEVGFWTWDCCCTGCCLTCTFGDTTECTSGETTVNKNQLA